MVRRDTPKSELCKEIPLIFWMKNLMIIEKWTKVLHFGCVANSFSYQVSTHPSPAKKVYNYFVGDIPRHSRVSNKHRIKCEYCACVFEILLCACNICNGFSVNMVLFWKSGRNESQLVVCWHICFYCII